MKRANAIWYLTSFLCINEFLSLSYLKYQTKQLFYGFPQLRLWFFAQEGANMFWYIYICTYMSFHVPMQERQQNEMFLRVTYYIYIYTYIDLSSYRDNSFITLQYDHEQQVWT